METKSMALRIICAILVAVMLFLPACSNPADDSSENNATTTSGSGQTTTEGEEPMPEFPHKVMEFNDTTFTVLVEDESMNLLKITDFDIDEEPADVFYEAIYRRNTYVEETFKIDIQSVHKNMADIQTTLTKAVQSGLTDYDAAAIRLSNATTAAMNGLAVNLNGLDYLSLDMPWWDQNIQKDLSIGGNSYVIAGDIFTKHYDAIAMMYFNKKLFEDYALEDPYKLVQNNEWTLEKFTQLTKGVTRDLDNDGQMTYKDFYGLSTQADFITSIINGSDMRFVEKDADDMPYFTGADEKIVSIFNKIFEFYLDDSFCYHRDGMNKGVSLTDRMIQFLVFPEDRALFLWGMPRFMDLELRNMESNFGMLPIPKYDSDQKNYYATANAWHSYAWIIPMSAADPDKTAYLMDAMGYYGRQYILPAYYDICLTRKYTRDEESSAMLDIIFNSIVYDIGDLFNLGSYRVNLEGMLMNNNNTVMSTYESAQTQIETDLDKLVTQFMENAP